MTAHAADSGSAAPPWPQLRSCLHLEPVTDEAHPFPSVIITDPIRGTYFKASWPLSGMLLVWHEAGTAAELAEAMRRQYGAAISDGDAQQAIDFLFKNELSQADEKGGWQRYHQLAKAARHGLMKKLIHNYLFFRIPLVHPDAWLKAILPALRFAFRPWFWVLVTAVAAVGLYLTTRQWSDVVAAFYGSLQFQHVALYAAALFVLKAVHELGHALTTAHFGCRVPSMGIAFMLGAPMLYTDASDSWRLTDKRRRLAIVFGGVAAETIVAAVALLAWPLLPDGPLRHICFGFATAAIAMSLAVNLNPFMRFDGYFALSDYLDVPNLQARSFALASWKLREVLFGLSEPPPERFARRKQTALIIYAYLVWIYRFFLYLGIAYVVYMMAGKAIGIVLGLFELVVFILRPMWREVQSWWSCWAQIRVRPRAAVTASVAAFGLLMVSLPCLTTVESPGVLVAGDEQELHVPLPARLKAVAVTSGQLVVAGDVLFEAASPDLDHKIRKASLQTRLLELRLSRLLSTPKDYEQTVVLKREFKAAKEKYDGLVRQRDALRITAPFSGRVADLDTALIAGTWVGEDQILARLISTGGARVKALLADTDLHRIAAGAKGVFVADEADLPSRPVVLTTIAPASDGKLSEPALADLHGGPVPSMTSERALRAKEGWVEAVYAAEERAPERVVRGVVRVEAEAQSPLSILWRQVGRVLVREQGF